jgi:hypothetical protein
MEPIIRWFNHWSDNRSGSHHACVAGRYERGIRVMADLLHRNGYAGPPFTSAGTKP